MGESAENSLNEFIQRLPRLHFTHQDLCKCYSIYMKNEYQLNKNEPVIHPVEQKNRQYVDGKRVPIRWSSVEIEALRMGVEKFGKGNWSKILGNFPTIFGPTGRTGRDLKKKWLSIECKNDSIKNFVKQNEIIMSFVEPQQQEANTSESKIHE